MQAFTPAQLLEISSLVVYPKEIAELIRKTKRTAQLLLNDIRFALGKEDHQLVTLGELCAYLGMDLIAAFALLREKKLL